jgi:hypothetical protein
LGRLARVLDLRDLEQALERYALIDPVPLPTEDDTYVLLVACLACNREPGMPPCELCTRMERAERAVGRGSPELVTTP